MAAAEAITKIIDKCDLLLDGEVFSKEHLMQSFGNFLSQTTEKEDHNVGFVLHTGSVCFDALALAYAAITCLIYNDSNVADVISSLNIGDSVLYGTKKKSRYVFKGHTTHSSSPGIDYIHLWQGSSGSTYVPSNLWRYIIPYYGTSKTMDSRGLRKRSNAREEFYLSVLGYDPEEIPSVLNVSAVVAMNKDRINDLAEKLTIRFDNKEVKLTELVTVSYYTENDEYPFGGNVAKTEPIVKVTNKVSVARRLILSRNGNKHIGLIAFGNEIISRNISELPELINRKSLQYVYLLMNMDSDNALPLIHDTEKPNVFLCSKDFLLSNLLPSKHPNRYTDELSRQVDAIIDRNIEPHIMNGYFSWPEYRDFKKAIFLIKKSELASDEKEDFIIAACSLMNIFLTAVFKITELEKCIADNVLDILSVEKRFEELRHSASQMPDVLKEKTKIIISALETAYLSLTEISEKEDYLRRILSENHDKSIAVVVPKSYYATVMRECGFFDLMDSEELLTITTANRFDNSVIYDRIIVIGNFAGKRFDVFRCMASQRIETLLYEFESNLYRYRMRSAKKAEAELNSMNTVAPVEEEDAADYLFYFDNADEGDVAEIAEIDVEVDDYVAHLNEVASFRSLESFYATQGAGQTSDVVAFGTFDSGETIFFTKLYKAYVFDDGNGTVRELKVKDLSEGDSLVFTQNNSETRDIVDTILSKLIDERKFNEDVIECYRKSKYWKRALRKYMLDNNIPEKSIAATMIENGVNVQEITIRGWLDEDSHTVGPRHEDSIQQIALLVEDTDMFENAKEYYDACATIRKIRRDILSQIGKAIIDKLSGREPAAGTIMADVYERTGAIARILRLESIVSVERNVPINLTNRPLNL